MKIIITLPLNKVVEYTPEEARQLYQELKLVFEQQIYIPTCIQPVLPQSPTCAPNSFGHIRHPSTC